MLLVYKVKHCLSDRLIGKDDLSFLCKILKRNFYYSLLIQLFTINFNFYSFFISYFNNFDTFDILFSYISYATLISIYFLRSFNRLFILYFYILIGVGYNVFYLFIIFDILFIFFNLASSF